jgi:hypothetical protein
LLLYTALLSGLLSASRCTAHIDCLATHPIN